MTLLPRPRREAFAHALARGATPANAALEAGYSSPKKGAALARGKDIADRANEIKDHLARGGSRDLGGVIDRLFDNAERAWKLESAGGMTAAKSSLVEAARLKQLLPEPSAWAAPGPIYPHDEDLTDEQWMARYGPDPPLSP
ncbi:MAG: hypothetical protein ACYC8V_12150 [Caulobacteraceae bacterium]